MKRTALFTAVVSLFFGSSLIGETNTDELTSGYNSPARIDVQGSWDIFFTGSYIYWQPKEEGLELGYLLATDSAEEDYICNMDFDYKSGFKVGLGTNFDHDNWTMYLEYTQLHTQNHRNIPLVDTADYVVEPFWNSLVGYDYATSATASWRLRYDVLDLTLNRPFYSGTCLALAAFSGLKGGWINQKYSVGYQFYIDQFVYDVDTVYYGTARTNSWVIGPQVGLNLNCLLGAGFRFFGTSSASLLYQKLKTSIAPPVSSYYASLGYRVTEKETYNQITPNVNLSAGLAWNSYFDNNNWNFDLSAAYEFQYYWNQNRMKKLVDATSIASVSGKAKDLVLNGLTITARLDF